MKEPVRQPLLAHRLLILLLPVAPQVSRPGEGGPPAGVIDDLERLKQRKILLEGGLRIAAGQVGQAARVKFHQHRRLVMPQQGVKPGQGGRFVPFDVDFDLVDSL